MSRICEATYNGHYVQLQYVKEKSWKYLEEETEKEKKARVGRINRWLKIRDRDFTSTNGNGACGDPYCNCIFDITEESLDQVEKEIAEDKKWKEDYAKRQETDEE